MPRPLLYVIGTFFWTGFFPIAPATVASAGVMVVWWAVWAFLGPVPLWLRHEALRRPNARQFVGQVWAGMLVTYLGLNAGLYGWIAGFFWFRFFDILKPLGVRRLEKLGGGLGIMADDIGAGILAASATQATARLLGWIP